ncbi:MAG: hypothetical protein VX447_09165 [Pseudomonadota bacterium]|nr:hypothetical protein [Gallaecimonas pentaromativorans]MED5524907.1 hypothetical protein [Pseudomonadota bacterium]
MSKKPTPMTQEAVNRIKEAEAKKNGGTVSKDGFVGRAEKALQENKKQ